MVDLERLAALRLFSLIPRRNIPTGAMRSASERGRDAGRLGVDAQLQAAREQIDMLLRRMNVLVGNADGAWETREPPPEYV
jgi:hypothetical protein